MKTICIVHFQPLERYPPVVNLLRALQQKAGAAYRIQVITTANAKDKYQLELPGIAVRRIAKRSRQQGKAARLFFYLKFMLLCYWILIRSRPHALLYYETISAGGPLLYCTSFGRKASLFVHYHEYTSPQEYQTGMLLNRYLHQWEKRMLRRAYWVSHTNADRMEFFCQDLGKQAPRNKQILPNYPPESWRRTAPQPAASEAEKAAIVYVGSLSLENMYVKEMAQWVAAHAGQCFWHIYSDNHEKGVVEYLASLNAPNIQFKGAVVYDELPGLLAQYQVGLILYNGHIPNYVYNVPNKFYEYYCCGLDTWFPALMKSCLPLQTRETYPKVLGLDFEQLTHYTPEALLNKKGYRLLQQSYTSQQVYAPIIAALLEKA